MKNVLENLLGFIYSLSMGDYFFFVGTFLLIVLFVYIIYLIKCSELEENDKKDLKKVTSNETLDLEAIVESIETDYKPEKIELTHYEEEQENSAIISYEELVKNKDKLGINYDDEYIFEAPELEVKKISLSKDGTTEVQAEPKLEVKLMHYDKEEAFLKALKELQNNLSQ